MSYRNDRFANGCLSLDLLFDDRMSDKSRSLSDGGAGVARLVTAIDYDPSEAEGEEATARTRHERICGAVRQRFRRAGMGYLMPTFLLICRNGPHRNESIAEIARRRNLPLHVAKARYFVHRRKIIRLLTGQ